MVHGEDYIDSLSSAKLHGSFAEVNQQGVLRQPIKAEEEGAGDRNVFVVDYHADGMVGGVPDSDGD